MAFTFNGISKTITLSTGTTTVSVRDMWSRWVDWLVVSDNSKYLPAFDFVGGNDIDQSQGTKIPIYLFLTNGWRVKPQEASHRLNVGDGILLVAGGGDPFIDTDGNFIVRINYQQPVQAISFSSEGGAAFDYDLAAAAVWNKLVSDHTTGGTFGGEIATKVDVKAAAFEEPHSPLSGTIVFGDLISGTFANVAIKDTTYWQIGENTTNGITVEFVFNLMDGVKPGLISVSGRYTGFPAGSHYIELWAYNHQVSAWEELQEEFMPGGNSVDSDYTHEFYETHIDRSNNNEVKVRLIHNTATYNTNHRLYVDKIYVSGIVTTSGGLSVLQSTQLEELYTIRGLDENNPMVITENQESAGDIVLDISGDGTTISTVTRQ